MEMHSVTGSADVAQIIRSYNELATGVPNTDACLKEMLKFLTEIANDVERWIFNPAVKSRYEGLIWTGKGDQSESWDGEGELHIPLSEQYRVEIHHATDRDDDSTYLVARFRPTPAAFPSSVSPLAPFFKQEVSVPGLRQLLAEVKAYGRDLVQRGPCPRCVAKAGDRTGLRNPSAEVCHVCCFQMLWE